MPDQATSKDLRNSVKNITRLPDFPHSSAKDYFKNKELHTTASYDEMTAEMHQVYFTVAHVQSMETLERLQKLMTKAIKDKTPFILFKQKFNDIVEEEATDYKFQADLVYSTIMSAYNAGKWEKFQKSKKKYPYLKYITANDTKVRAGHRIFHNMIRHIDDPFWLQGFPPNGYRCRCTVVQLTKKEGEQKAKKRANSKLVTHIDKGFELNPAHLKVAQLLSVYAEQGKAELIKGVKFAFDISPIGSIVMPIVHMKDWGNLNAPQKALTTMGAAVAMKNGTHMFSKKLGKDLDSVISKIIKPTEIGELTEMLKELGVKDALEMLSKVNTAVEAATLIIDSPLIKNAIFHLNKDLGLEVARLSVKTTRVLNSLMAVTSHPVSQTIHKVLQLVNNKDKRKEFLHDNKDIDDQAETKSTKIEPTPKGKPSYMDIYGHLINGRVTNPDKSDKSDVIVPAWQRTPSRAPAYAYAAPDAPRPFNVDLYLDILDLLAKKQCQDVLAAMTRKYSPGDLAIFDIIGYQMKTLDYDNTRDLHQLSQ